MKTQGRTITSTWGWGWDEGKIMSGDVTTTEQVGGARIPTDPDTTRKNQVWRPGSSQAALDPGQGLGGF